MRDIIRKVDRNEYKRQQAAPGLRITHKGFRSRPPLPNRTQVLPNENYSVRAHCMAGTLLLGGFLVLHSRRDAPQRESARFPDGGFLLNSGWAIRPAGQQVPVDTFPMSAAVSPYGKYLLVLNGGYNPPIHQCVDIAQKKELGRTPLPDAWLGLRFAPSGNNALRRRRQFRQRLRIRVERRDRRVEANSPVLSRTQSSSESNNFIGDVVTSPDAHVLYAANVYGDSISVINLASGLLIDEWKCRHNVPTGFS